jgi:hypothetical protein
LVFGKGWTTCAPVDLSRVLIIAMLIVADESKNSEVVERALPCHKICCIVGS